MIRREKLIIQGGTFLGGSVTISGSKNACLPILASTILTNEDSIIENVPHLQDISGTLSLLNHLGSDVCFMDKMKIKINTSSINTTIVPSSLSDNMRASILVLGPMLAKHKAIEMSLPGGCAIGDRPIDLHIKALESMQASIEIKNGIIYAKAPKGLQATDFTFGVISVTGTENIVMAATLANGTSVLRNCAVEPEVTNLIKVLNEMGAKITGIGTETLTIEGVKKLSATKPHKVVADRIEAGTFLAMAAATGKEIVLKGITSELMAGILDAFKRMGFSFSINDEKQEITMHAEDISTLKSIDLSTAPYPRFPTDIQAQFCVLNCLTQGNSSITETIFENRFLYCEELNKMGAKLKIDKKTCNIIGGIKFYGAKVRSTDLRASASLAIAALVATGETEIYDIYHLDRGYERIEEKMLNLGVTIHRKSI